MVREKFSDLVPNRPGLSPNNRRHTRTHRAPKKFCSPPSPSPPLPPPKMLNIGGDVRDANHRYKMPALATKTESRGNGVKTVVVNMAAVAKALRVDPRCRFCERVLFFFSRRHPCRPRSRGPLGRPAHRRYCVCLPAHAQTRPSTFASTRAPRAATMRRSGARHSTAPLAHRTCKRVLASSFGSLYSVRAAGRCVRARELALSW